MKLTRARLRALRWIADREPVYSFTADGPSLHFVRKLCDDGLVTRVGKDKGLFGFIRYGLTDAGRAALAQREG